MYLKFHILLLKWKRNKLKLGKVIFEIKAFEVEGFVLWDDLEIRYVRQDNTKNDENKLESLIDSYSWKNDWIHYSTVIFLTSIGIWQIRKIIKLYLYKTFPTFYIRDEHLDYIVKYNFENIVFPKNIGCLAKLNSINYMFIDIFVNFCSYFNVFF